MKKITLLFAFIISSIGWAQLSCDGAVPLTNGYTANITTPGLGAGSPGSWVTSTVECGGGFSSTIANPTCFHQVFTTAGDDYLFSYTTGDVAGESVYLEIQTTHQYHGLLGFRGCNGTAFTNCFSGSYIGANNGTATMSISASNLQANETIYFAVGIWSTPNNLNFSVTNFTVTPAPTANVEDFSINKIVAYPNPVTDVLNLSYPEIINNVIVYNILGQQVINKNFNTNEVKVDVAMLPVGNYIVKANTISGRKTIKVIKQ